MTITKTVARHRTLKVRIDGAPAEIMNDTIAVESPLAIVVNGKNYATLMCTPEALEDLVVGHLVSEGIAHTPKQVTRLQIAGHKCEVSVADSDFQRAIGGTNYPYLAIERRNNRLSKSVKSEGNLDSLTVASRVVFPISVLQRAVNALNKDTSIYRRTGGVHAACLSSNDGKKMYLAEDVSRYNAVDKVIGRCALQGSSFQDKLLALTGRITGDIALKAAQVGIPVVASISAVVSSGIAVAEKTRLTVVGFVREGRMNIYTQPDRIHTRS